MDLDNARKRCRYAAIAAWISSAITLLVIIVTDRIAGGATGSEALDFIGDPMNLFDVAMLALLGLGVWFRSRVCAVLLLVYLIVSKIFMMATLGQPTGILGLFIWGYFYWGGIRGAFAWHRIRKETDESYRKTPVWAWSLAGFVLFLFISVIGFGIYLEGTNAPGTHVMAGNDIPAEYIEGLRQAELISADDKVHMFYSEAVFDFLAAGQFITDRQVISYETIEGELWYYAAAFEQITGLFIVVPGTYWEDTILQVAYSVGEIEESFFVFLSVENDGNRDFIRMLEEKTGLTAETLSDEAVQEIFENG